MSLTESRLHEALGRYADAVVVTPSDVERMQRTLDERLAQRHRPRRTRVVIAAVAATVLVLIAITIGAVWLRRGPAPVPASPQGVAPVPGVYLVHDGADQNLAVLHADGTETDYVAAHDLVHPVVPSVNMWHMEGDAYTLDVSDEKGQLCRGRSRMHPQPDGRILLDVWTLNGPGCGGRTSSPAISITRLSPASEAGQALTPSTEEPVLPVTDPVQLDGIWLVEGSGILLAARENIGAGSDYLIDATGNLDRAADANKGTLTMAGSGRVVLAASGCGDTVLDHVNVRGTSVPANRLGASTGLSVTATVTADPCNRFGGRSVVTWIRIL
jgi:hypothetical protein